MTIDWLSVFDGTSQICSGGAGQYTAWQVLHFSRAVAIEAHERNPLKAVSARPR